MEAIDNAPSQELVPVDSIIGHFPELQANPFAGRMCQVFSSNGGQEMTFVDFIDMASCFSENAPEKFKAEWAFKIFDFDEDGRIGREDIRDIVYSLTGGVANGSGVGDNRLDDRDVDKIVHKVMEEVDTKKMGFIQEQDFRNLMVKSTNFSQNLCIRFWTWKN